MFSTERGDCGRVQGQTHQQRDAAAATLHPQTFRERPYGGYNALPQMFCMLVDNTDMFIRSLAGSLSSVPDESPCRSTHQHLRASRGALPTVRPPPLDASDVFFLDSRCLFVADA